MGIRRRWVENQPISTTLAETIDTQGLKDSALLIRRAFQP